MKYSITRNEFLYFIFDDFHHVMRFRIHLTEEINGDLLNEAVQEAAARYPYFCLKVRRDRSRNRQSERSFYGGRI